MGKVLNSLAKKREKEKRIKKKAFVGEKERRIMDLMMKKM